MRIAEKRRRIGFGSSPSYPVAHSHTSFSCVRALPPFSGIRRKLTASLRKPPTVDSLRRRLQETPSINNRLALAQDLADAAHYAEARSLFEQARRVAD